MAGQVEMCRTLLPNADLLIYSALRREALASSTIEGTIATPDELVRFEYTRHSEREAVREVENYAKALAWGFHQLASLPLSSRLLLGLHERLLQGVRGASSVGRYKDRQNWIGATGSSPTEAAEFVPPSPEDTPRLMAALERYLNLENRELKLVQCALAHYQFETIHPFNGGNGRVGRLLIMLQMIQLRLLSAPLIYPSGYFERHRADYVGHLQAVRTAALWKPWIEFFVRGIAEQCGETIALTRTILDVQRDIEARIGSVRQRASILAAARTCFYQPVLTVREVAQRANMTINTAQRALNTLLEHDIVYELSGKQKGRIYACRPVLGALLG